MKAYQVQSFTGVEGLNEVDLPTPIPTGDEILVRMHAATLNKRDTAILTNTYPRNPGKPKLIPLSDGAGEVVAVGDQVTNFAPGDRVVATFIQTWPSGRIQPDAGEHALGGTVDGVLSEYKLFPAEGLIKIPPSLSYEEAAAFPCAGVTAWNALVEKGQLRAGETVLLLGTGGVSVFALQIARMHGAKVLITSSNESKLQRASAIGAEVLINYKKNPEWQKEVLEHTDGKGVDHVVEVGGGGTLARSLQCAAVGGNVHIIGTVSGKPTDIPAILLLAKSLRVNGIYVGSKAMTESMIHAFAINRIKPVIDSFFSWADVRSAYRQMDAVEHFGKLAISFLS